MMLIIVIGCHLWKGNLIMYLLDFFSLNVLISNPLSHFVLCCIPLLHADKMSNCQLLKQQQFWQKQKQERCKHTGIYSLPFFMLTFSPLGFQTIQWGVTLFYLNPHYLRKNLPMFHISVLRHHIDGVVRQYGGCLWQWRPGPEWRAAAKAGTCVTVVNDWPDRLLVVII